jgi:hypothetical protein
LRFNTQHRAAIGDAQIVAVLFFVQSKFTTHQNNWTMEQFLNLKEMGRLFFMSDAKHKHASITIKRFHSRHIRAVIEFRFERIFSPHFLATY